MGGGSKKKRIVFRIYAPEAREVSVAGNFNDWNRASHPLKKDGMDGTWQRIMYLAPGVYEYRFRVDGAWTDDPNAPERLPNEFGTLNCIVRM